MIRIEQLHIGYEQQILASQLQDITLRPSRFIALLGTNGSGKSTLLRAITTGNHILQGNVLWDTEKLTKLSDQQRARSIAVVLTNKELNPLLTVLELLEISRAPYTTFTGKLVAADKEIIEQTMELFECKALSSKRLQTLSDGQLQRALVARALVQDTPYLFMDEPSSHLDINHKASLLATLKEYCHEKNKCIVYASHELELAMQLSDEVLSIHKGIIAHSSTAAFIENDRLGALFPSEHVSFKDGKAQYHFK
jgi:iron complex transport system ATP-binding protein